MSDESNPPSMSEASRDELETLRHQRALIAAHLAWLDHEIAKLEAHEKDHGTPSKGERQSAPASNAKGRTVEAQPSPSKPEASNPDPLPEEFTNPERARAAGRQNARSIQAGCVVMGVIAVIAFLVFFFVVPYLVF